MNSQLRLSLAAAAAISRLICLALVLAAVLSPTVRVAAAPQPQTSPCGLISGTVTRAADGQPVSQAVVYLHAPFGTLYVPGPVETGVDGTYTISRLPAADYYISARHANFVEEYYLNATSDYNGTRITISGCQTVTGIDFSLADRGAISGRVYAQDGVTLLSYADVTIEGADSGWVEGTFRTNANGEYISAGAGPHSNLLLPGAYKVSATWLGSERRYHPSAAHPTTATVVNVTANTVTSNINIILHVPGGIRGRIMRPGGVDPYEFAWVHLENAAGEYVQYTQADSDGYYAFNNLGDGDYYVSGFADQCPPRYYPDAMQRSGAQKVRVTAPHTTENINITLVPGGSISGHVYAADWVTPLTADIWVQRTDEAEPTIFLPARFDGYYTYPLLITGNYWIKASMSSYLAEFYLESPTKAGARLVPVVIANDKPGIDFALDSHKTVYISNYTPQTIKQQNGATITLNFPVNSFPAAEDPYKVTLAVTSQWPTPPPGWRQITGFTELTTVAPDGQPITEFKQPVTGTIDYTSAEVGDLDERTITLFEKVPGGGWRSIPNLLDINNNRVTAQFQYPGQFALFINNFKIAMWHSLPFVSR